MSFERFAFRGDRTRPQCNVKEGTSRLHEPADLDLAINPSDSSRLVHEEHETSLETVLPAPT